MVVRGKGDLGYRLRQLAFVARDESTPATVIRCYVTGFRREVCLIRPQRPLRANTDYKLAMTPAKPFQSRLSASARRALERLQGFSVKTSDVIDKSAVAARPRLHRPSFQRARGDKTKGWIRFAIKRTGRGKKQRADLRRLEVEVTRTEGQEPHLSYRTLVTRWRVGRGRCEGSYGSLSSGAYRLRARWLDAAGNSGPFSKPATVRVPAGVTPPKIRIILKGGFSPSSPVGGSVTVLRRKASTVRRCFERHQAQRDDLVVHGTVTIGTAGTITDVELQPATSPVTACITKKLKRLRGLPLSRQPFRMALHYKRVRRGKGWEFAAAQPKKAR